MTKFHHLDFDLTGGMTERDFKDAIGAVSPFVVWRDADGLHSHTAEASNYLFNNGDLSSKNPIEIIAIGAGVQSLSTFCPEKTSLVEFVSHNWDTSKVATFARCVFGCASLKRVDLSRCDTSSATSFQSAFANNHALTSVGLPTIKAGCNTNEAFQSSDHITDIYFGADALVYAPLDLSPCPLTYQSVCNVLDALADTPDEGARITFKSGLYAGFTAEQKAVIDAKRNAAVANGWTIANMS